MQILHHCATKPRMAGLCCACAPLKRTLFYGSFGSVATLPISRTLHTFRPPHAINAPEPINRYESAAAQKRAKTSCLLGKQVSYDTKDFAVWHAVPKRLPDTRKHELQPSVHVATSILARSKARCVTRARVFLLFLLC